MAEVTIELAEIDAALAAPNDPYTPDRATAIVMQEIIDSKLQDTLAQYAAKLQATGKHANQLSGEMSWRMAENGYNPLDYRTEGEWERIIERADFSEVQDWLMGETFPIL